MTRERHKFECVRQLPRDAPLQATFPQREHQKTFVFCVEQRCEEVIETRSKQVKYTN